jgi:sarcosine oxidase
VAVGAWAPELLGPPIARLFKIYRQVQCWFAPENNRAAFRPDRFPVFIWELPSGRRGLYGFPAIDGVTAGVKVATEAFERTSAPDLMRREVDPEEISEMHGSCVAPYLKDLGPDCVRASTCLYTVTPDFGFVIDAHPDDPRILIASACSGHGFKHSPAVGDVIAQLVLEGRAKLDLSPFGLARLAKG